MSGSFSDTGKDVSILRDRIGATKERPVRSLTLKRLRETKGQQRSFLEVDGGGGCGCFTDEDE